MLNFLIVSLFLPSAVDGGSLPPQPVYVCRHIDHELPIVSATDGGNRDTAGGWAGVPSVPLVNVVDGSETVSSTRFQAIWTDRNLYVRFDCEDTDVRGAFRERDAPVFEEDVVEVFLNPSGDQETYYEIDVNPLNTVFDALILNPSDLGKASILKEWNPRGLKTLVEVRKQDESPPLWTVIFAIPFEEMITAPNRPPEPGDRWRWNVYRIDRGAGGDEYQAWSPTGAVNFHLPERFGILEFVR